jgi:hypothetical protein
VTRLTFKCFRVSVKSAQPVADLERPWRVPAPPPVLTDEFELREAAIECARLAERDGMHVIACDLVNMEDGEEQITPVDWTQRAAA